MRLPRLRLLLVLLLTQAASPAQSEPPGEKKPPVRLDRYGDPLPAGVLARIGSSRLRQSNVSSLSFSPDGKTLAADDSEGSLHLWDVATGKRLRRFAVPKGWWNVTAFSVDGRTLTCAGGEKAVEVRRLDTSTGKALTSVQLPATTLYRMIVSPDGKLVAGDLSGPKVGKVGVHDSATGNQIVSIPGHGSGLQEMAFRADGKTIAISDLTDTVRAHDTATGR